MNLFRLTGVALLMLGLAGCANIRNVAPAALSLDAGPVNVGPSAKAATKRGEACIQNILGLIATGDASIDAAKQDGGITTVTSIDQSSTRVLGYYAKFCTIVKGQ